VPLFRAEQTAQFRKQPLSYCWFSEVYRVPENFFVAQVRRTVPARQDKGDRHRSKHFRDGRDTFAGEIHIKNRCVWAHLPKQFKGRPEASGWTHHLIARTPKRLLKLHGYQKLILYD
jgi:hypothetical protein